MRDADGWNRVLQLANTVRPDELASLDVHEVLRRLFAEEAVRVYSSRDVRHDFPPDREKIADILRSLGEAEVRRLLDEHGEVSIEDELSNHRYRFSADEALALFAPPTLH
ncbi:MAG: hypothetical protein BSR46_16875 [Candidatus Dactylopiibacterium carminicum]|uniref:Hsp33 family molecular chaperone HslO n=1 Tax=Candidatus Dactylopiibacterium carminicum TaxID=857335 RepID=UPI000BD13C86|nr:Hsp33 family molecular chaperone HslO [Candidatus Dactylopiibacterium carminicum]PAS95524.1 MAG: hypothetical protein BSR46_16875 [Candidatus Dactylopiibacterium carminicum]